MLRINVPLNSPLHTPVRDSQRRDKVQHLIPAPAHNVPEALADESSHGALAVGRQDIGDDALAGAAAALVGVTPGADVPSRGVLACLHF
jgi:hypothetical protein